MSSVQQVDFLVVGAGPVGASLALSLAQISPDLSVVLVDHSPELINSPERIDSPESENENSLDSQPFDTKVFAVNSGSTELFKNLDVWQRIQDQRLCPYQRMHVWDAEGTGSVTFDASELGVNELGHIIEANIIQTALNEKIQATNSIQVCRPAQIIRLEHQGELSLVELDSGDQFNVSLVCAADGARSALRSASNIRVNQDDCQQHALVANLRLSQPHECCAWQIFRPTGPLAFLPLPTEDQQDCSIVWSLDTEEAHRIQALDDQDFVAELERAIEGRFGHLDLISDRLSFPLMQQHAEDYGVPGLVLVGDAAHSIHPLAGLGANLGFQDVNALSEELSRAHERLIGFGHPMLINRYQRRRKIDNELVIKLMKLFRVSFADHGMMINAVRNLGLHAFSVVPGLKKAIAQQALMSGSG